MNSSTSMYEMAVPDVLRKHVIHVSQTVLPVHSFDNEGFRLVTGPPKTSAGDRRIPIPAWVPANRGG